MSKFCLAACPRPSTRCHFMGERQGQGIRHLPLLGLSGPFFPGLKTLQ